MKFIIKAGHQPQFLQQFKKEILEDEEKGIAKYSDTFDALNESTRLKLQHQLAAEQGFICCYCMGAIKIREREDGQEVPIMRIEHFKPQSIFNGLINSADQAEFLCDKQQTQRTDLRIDYYNLFCACEGTGRNKEQFCDVKKGNQELCKTPNPSKNNHKRFFSNMEYTYNGKMVIPEELEDDLKKTLNLNAATLVDKRKSVWSAVTDLLNIAAGGPNWNQGGLKLERKVKELFEKYSKRRNNGKFYPYCDFVTYLLRKRFRNLLENN